MPDKCVAIIPARLAATRLPNKPLLDIAGKPMIQRVYERVARASHLADILVATPDEAILEIVHGFGGKAILTSNAHRTGTDRVAEAAATLPNDVTHIVNAQGDEPLINPVTIDALVLALASPPDTHPEGRVPLSSKERGRRTDFSSPSPSEERATRKRVPGRGGWGVRSGDEVMASVMCPLPQGRETDPDVVKVVCDLNGNALYFSRSPLPYRRNPDVDYCPMQHVGMYAYRREFLQIFPTLPQTSLERTESLEQLRALENGYRIRMVATEKAPESVDTPEDLIRVRALFERES